jgi:hypothetical protein
MTCRQSLIGCAGSRTITKINQNLSTPCGVRASDLGSFATEVDWIRGWETPSSQEPNVARIGVHAPPSRADWTASQAVGERRSDERYAVLFAAARPAGRALCVFRPAGGRFRECDRSTARAPQLAARRRRTARIPKRRPRPRATCGSRSTALGVRRPRPGTLAALLLTSRPLPGGAGM